MIQAAFSIEEKNATPNYAEIVFEPLEKGYGHTVGNSLRRVLLSSLGGVAVTSVKVKGIQHQFTTLKGMNEDIVELILGIKQLRLSAKTEGPFTLRLNAVKGKTELKGSDVVGSEDCTVVNKDLHLATLADAKLEVEMTAEWGQGYSLASERKSDVVGVIPVDASFSPVVKVSYTVEATRVGRRTDFDRLVMNVWTDGTVLPMDAVKKAAEILVRQFQQVVDPTEVMQPVDTISTASVSQQDQMLALTVEELDLPTRVANALRKGGYKTVADLTKAKKAEAAKVKNLGEKSVDIVEEALNKKGFSFLE